MLPSESNSSSRPRFSIATLLLLLTTLCTLAAWWGANQRFVAALRQNAQLQQENAVLSAELAKLTVIDDTKVHAIGLPQTWPDPTNQSGLRFAWRLFLPHDRSWHVAITEDLVEESKVGETSRAPRRGEVRSGTLILSIAVLDAENHLDAVQLVCSVDGKSIFEMALPGFDTTNSIKIDFMLGPHDRGVWEPGERPLLLTLSHLDVDRPALHIWLSDSSQAEPEGRP